MSIAYGIVALVSLCMVGICVTVDKKHDVWLLLLFGSVSICNLGYFMLSISKDLNDALNSNRLSYLGSVFLPFFLMMMVLRFCGMKRSKWGTISLVTLGVIMLAITTSPGILPIYYSSVNIEFVNGVTKLVREYGPFHLLYYVYLIGYMFAMIGIAFYAIAKKKIKSRTHTVLLLCTVFCNIVIWLVEQFLPRGFEWLSVSYIITESLILAIYYSMQKHGLLNRNEKIHSYTINVLITVFLLLFANFLRVATNNTTSGLYVAAQLFALVIHTGILVFWGMSIYDRIINHSVRRYLTVLVCLMMFWMLMHTLRYTVFFQISPYNQWCWYAYYISMILIPQFCLIASQFIGKPEGYKLPWQWHLLYIPSGLLIGGFLTNDIHQWAFRFPLGYVFGLETTFEYGFLFNIAIIWMFGCIAFMMAEFFRRCRIPKTKKVFWLPITMLLVCFAYAVLYMLDVEIFGFIELYITICFLVVGIWESSIKTGLIQSNGQYDELLESSGLGVVVVNNDYDFHYRSDGVLQLSREDIRLAVQQPMLTFSGVRICGSKIRGGYVLWQENLSELIENLEELNALREELSDSNAVAMKNYQMNKHIQSLEEKNRLHDEIHRQTASQINRLGELLEQLHLAENEQEKKELLRKIVVVGAYLKRRNNLILVGEQDSVIKEEEFNLSVCEMTKNLQLTGINSACLVQFGKELPVDIAMQLFDFCQTIVEDAFDGLEQFLVRFFCRENSYYCCVDIISSLDLSYLESEKITVSQFGKHCYTVSLHLEGGEGVC